MVKGTDVEIDGILLELHAGNRVQDIEEDVIMAEHDAFGLAGGAARIDEKKEVIRIDRNEWLIFR